MKKVLVSMVIVASAMASTSAHAWGEREQGILTGVAGLWVFQQLNKAGQPQPPVVYQQPPVVYQQAPVVVYQAPVPRQYCESKIMTDQFGQERAFTSCYYR